MKTLNETSFAHAARERGRIPALVALLLAVQAGLRSLAGHVGRFAASWHRYGDAVAMAKALGELDDHTLRDLGIHRSELRSLSHDPCDVTRTRSAWSC